MKNMAIEKTVKRCVYFWSPIIELTGMVTLLLISASLGASLIGLAILMSLFAMVLGILKMK